MPIHNPVTICQEDSTSGDSVVQKSTNSAAEVWIASHIAGARNAGVAADSFSSVSEEWLYAIVNLETASTTVSAVPTIIGNIWVNTVLSAHACPIKDDTTTLFSLPASAPATTTEATAFTFMKGTAFATSLVVDPDDSATGTIVVQYRIA